MAMAHRPEGDKVCLKSANIDGLGLDSVDRNVLLTIIKKFDGGPVGLDTLAASTGEEPDTIEDVYEPFLLQLGFLQKTPRGRKATRLAYEHLGIQYMGGDDDSDQVFMMDGW